MLIEKDKVVQFFYTLKDETGVELESNLNAEPVAYLHGHKNMMPGVEAALAGREAARNSR